MYRLEVTSRSLPDDRKAIVRILQKQNGSGSQRSNFWDTSERWKGDSTHFTKTKRVGIVKK